ncbi:GntR family transcriptional regulator [Xylanibacillus composti]|uniref:GntR family transcriptional regulator n=1 Tax=Xylanibacillus composti TaxID=1572762 RepID=A0A8J4M0U6_9BACL|nr:GntR family transcriptional regulator [Xylanibacillus composti]MDT9723968.1 GntR family transcriptional regulator [Xylanibacillus composti]GIQ67849.1 GntR family transcriptional regulator [Xylanibacillus composti]
MRIPIHVSPDSPEPMYHQIENQLRSLIWNGQLAAGSLMPSIRELAQDLACSVITIRRVYQDLEGEGLLRTKQGTGTFVVGVSEEKRSGYQMETVVKALEDAVRTGFRLQCTSEQLRQWFEQVLAEQGAADAGKGGAEHA